MKDNHIIKARKEIILDTFPKAKDFISSMNPFHCTERFAAFKTATACILSGKITFSEIKDIYGKDSLIAYLCVWLMNLNLFVNVKYRLQDNQIREIALLISEDHEYLNLADFTLVFKRIKTGFYGKLYNALSGEYIMSCFNQYKTERMREMQIIRENYLKENSYPIQSQVNFIVKGIDYMPNVKSMLKKK